MSSMLEQAIIDAAALREAALKNAEQAIIEKFAPDIKSAVDSLLEAGVEEKQFKQNDIVKYEGRFARVRTESDNGHVGVSFIGEDKTHLVLEADLEESNEDALLQEQEGMLGGMPGAQSPEATIQAPFAAADISPDRKVEFNLEFDFDPADFNIDLEQLKDIQLQSPESAGEEPIGTDELVSDLGLEPPEESPVEDEGGEEAIKEILDLLSEIDEEEVLEEELIVDTSEQKTGWISTDSGSRQYEQALELARRESTEFKEENEELLKKIEELDEKLTRQRASSSKLKDIVNELSNSLDETLLSNAKLLYSNRTLSDTSLNERQKSKIVEAIAKSKTPDEAKSLFDTLKTTVGSTKSKGPQSLSESVQRRSNLSGILPRKNNNPQEHSFSDRMKALAGIK